MGWRDQLLKKGKDIVGRAMPKSKSKLVKDKTGTIKGVKPMSGNIPWHVSAGKTPKERAAIVKTHFSLERSRKIDKAVKDVKEGKKTLKDMVDTKQAEELKDYKGKGTGIFHKKGFK